MTARFDPLRLKRDKALDPTVTAVLIVDMQRGELTDAHRTEKPAYWQAMKGSVVPAAMLAICASISSRVTAHSKSGLAILKA